MKYYSRCVISMKATKGLPSELFYVNMFIFADYTSNACSL